MLRVDGERQSLQPDSISSRHCIKKRDVNPRSFFISHLMSSIVFSVLIHVETQVLAEDLEFRQNSRRLEAKFYLNSASKLCVGK